MFYKRFTFNLILRLLVINLLAYLLFYLIQYTQLWISIIGTAFMLIVAIVSLYYYINQIHSDIKRFILAVKTRDHTLNFKNKAVRGSFPELYESFGDILQLHKQIRLEQEAMFLLIKTILEQVPVGVIVISNTPINDENQEIAFFNQAASNLLAVPAYKYWHRLKQHLPVFANEIALISKGGKRFLELRIQEKLIQLSTEVIPLNLYGKNYTIISFQNIKDEIEQKETETWNRLIGVISHEILNSITPISSLSDTINSMVTDKNNLNPDEMEDLKIALQTIKRRSAGLLDFVKDYRLIAELPTPNFELHHIGELLKHIKTLMQPFAKAKNVQLAIEQTASKTSIQLDLKLIEQVLINLITNSIYAVEGIKNPAINLNYRLGNSKLYLDISDNGKGIKANDLEKIFLPFYTTRQNGSGIGLTISRNIMKMHGGNIEVVSTYGEGATFSVVFNLN